MTSPNDPQIAQPMNTGQKGTDRDERAWTRLVVAWGIAAISALAVLFVGEVMGQAPCVLCWFQRAFMFPLAIILGIAAFRSDFAIWRYAMPLAGIGALFAFYHSLVYAGAISEKLSPCSQGVSCASGDMVVLGFLPLPILSFGSFVCIAALTYSSKREATS